MVLLTRHKSIIQDLIKIVRSSSLGLQTLPVLIAVVDAPPVLHRTHAPLLGLERLAVRYVVRVVQALVLVDVCALVSVSELLLIARCRDVPRSSLGLRELPTGGPRWLCSDWRGYHR